MEQALVPCVLLWHEESLSLQCFGVEARESEPSMGQEQGHPAGDTMEH